MTWILEARNGKSDRIRENGANASGGTTNVFLEARWSKMLDTAIHTTDFEDESLVKPGDTINVINHSLQLLRRG